MRNSATPAEKLLWTKLNRKQIDGQKFRRQHPIGLYVLDFYCVELQFCIELDGDQHGHDENQLRDERRTQYLNRLGISVIRFWNHEIFENLDAVVDKIYDEATMCARDLAVKRNDIPSL